MLRSKTSLTMLRYISAVLILLLDSVISAPPEVAAGGSADVTIPRLISLENGNIGVNFLGFRASAGLGGLLTGNSADGGLHAGAGTPFGQAARAGLGGSVNGQGKTVGGLYADATAGGGVGAAAGLAGHTGPDGSYGKSFAGSSAGGFSKETSAIKPGIGLRGSFQAPTAGETVVENIKTVKFQPRTTYIERTVVPNYQEKTIYVPRYVEKTIEVPVAVKQRVKVSAPPTYIEKQVNVPQPYFNYDTSIYKEVVPETTVYRKTKIRRRPHLRKHVWLGDVYNRSYDAGSTGSYNDAISVRKTANPQLFNDIFNIPISTLQAVNKLVGGIAGGTSGSVNVSKSVNANY